MAYHSRTEAELTDELTRLKQENQKLRNEKNSGLQDELMRLQQAVRDSGEIIFMTDVSGIITFVNKEFTNVYGYLPGEVIGITTPRILKSGVTDSSCYKMLWSSILNRQISKNEFINKTKDGRLIVIEGSANAILNSEKVIIGFLAIQRDITELKNADQVLRNSEESYRGLFNSISDAVYILDSDGSFIDLNESALEIAGFSREELLGKTEEFLDAPTKNDIVQIMKNIKQVFESGIPYKFEFWLQKKTGIVIPCEVLINKVKYFGKDVLIAISRDITERKMIEDELNNYQAQLENNIEQRAGELRRTVKRLEKEIEERVTAEENLKTSEEKYRSLAEASPSGIMISKFNLIKFCNPKSAEIFGVQSPSDLIDKSLTDFLLPEDLEIMNKSRKSLRDSILESFDTLYRIRKNDGSTATIESISIYYPLEGDNCFLSFISDVTARINTQKSLEESEQRFRIAAQTISDVVWELDLNNGVIDWYGDIDGFLGYEPDQFPRTLEAWKNSIFENDLDRVADSLTNHRQKGIPFREEYRIRKKDGSLAYCIDQGMAIRDGRGNAYKMIGAFKDITERKVTEDRIAAALTEKEVLLREIHHRVKNNLQTIIYLIDMQIETLRGNQATITLFKELQTKVRTMSLIHEHLYKSKNLSRIDINDYLRSLVSNLLTMYNNSIRINLKLDHTITFLNFETAIPCGMIINELVTNSMKYAFPEDFRPVNDPEINIEFYKTEDSFILVVEDNGVGIKNDINLQETESLGLKLVNLWATFQLAGTLSLDRSKGMRYQIKFKKEK